MGPVRQLDQLELAVLEAVGQGRHAVEDIVAKLEGNPAAYIVIGGLLELGLLRMERDEVHLVSRPVRNR